VSWDLPQASLAIAIGAFALVHFLGKARRGLREGVSVGRCGKAYPRPRRPILYWVVLGGNAMAGVIGFALMVAFAAMRAL
jgi:hypothetical protein